MRVLASTARTSFRASLSRRKAFTEFFITPVFWKRSREKDNQLGRKSFTKSIGIHHDSEVGLPARATTTLRVVFSASIESIFPFRQYVQDCENSRASGFFDAIKFFCVFAVDAMAKIWVAKRGLVEAFAVELETACFFAFAWLSSDAHVLEKSLGSFFGKYFLQYRYVFASRLQI
jgi:hypothetical protein